MEILRTKIKYQNIWTFSNFSRSFMLLLNFQTFFVNISPIQILQIKILPNPCNCGCLLIHDTELLLEVTLITHILENIVKLG